MCNNMLAIAPKIDKKIDNKKSYIVALMCAILFIILAVLVMCNKTTIVDKKVYGCITKIFMSDTNTKVLDVITDFGSILYIIVISIVLFCLSKNKYVGIAVCLNAVIITSMCSYSKMIFERQRPSSVNWLIEEGGYSFPSGHSLTSMAYYGFLIYLIQKYIKNKYIKNTLTVLLSILIFCIGFSRIYLGVHYFTDVLGGFLLGGAYCITFSKIAQKCILNKEWTI